MPTSRNTLSASSMTVDGEGRHSFYISYLIMLLLLLLYSANDGRFSSLLVPS